jgi:hypothetical protein
VTLSSHRPHKPSSYKHSGLSGRITPACGWALACANDRTHVVQGRFASLNTGSFRTGASATQEDTPFLHPKIAASAMAFFQYSTKGRLTNLRLQHNTKQNRSLARAYPKEGIADRPPARMARLQPGFVIAAHLRRLYDHAPGFSINQVTASGQIQARRVGTAHLEDLRVRARRGRRDRGRGLTRRARARALLAGHFWHLRKGLRTCWLPVVLFGLRGLPTMLDGDDGE